MTDTRIVNGQEVIATERVPSNLSKRKDRPPVYWESVVQLLLADETTIYGCTACDFVDEKAGRVRWHYSTVHRGKLMGHAAARAKRNGQVQKAEPEPLDDFEEFLPEDEDDILAALEAALNGDGDSEKVAELEAKIATLEAKIAEQQREAENLTAEREWWKAAAKKANDRLTRLRTALQGVVTSDN